MKSPIFHTLTASLLLVFASSAFAQTTNPEPSESLVDAKMTVAQVEMVFGSLDFAPEYLSVRESKDTQGTVPHMVVVIGGGAVWGGAGYLLDNGSDFTWSGLAGAAVGGGVASMAGGARFAGAVFGTASRIATRYGGARGARLSQRLDGWSQSSNVQTAFGQAASFFGGRAAGAAVDGATGGGGGGSSSESRRNSGNRADAAVNSGDDTEDD